MKRSVKILITLLAGLLFLTTPAGCAASQPKPAADPKIPQMSEQEMSTPLGEDGTGLTPGEIKVLVDKALRQEYGITDFSSYQFHAYRAQSGAYYARYTLYIQGYCTYESYKVTLTEEGQVEYVNALDQGKYSRYLNAATEKRMAAAVADIESQARGYELNEGAYSLSIDDEGYLCLWVELIVDVPDGQSGDCGDHDHLFFHSRVCGPDT